MRLVNDAYGLDNPASWWIKTYSGIKTALSKLAKTFGKGKNISKVERVSHSHVW